MRVLIGGGSGFVGHYLRRLLALKGHEAVVLSRNTMPEHDHITWNDLIHKNCIPNDIDAVVNLSGHNLMDWSKRMTPGFQETLRASRIDTTSMLAEMINNSENPPSVFICASAIGIYPPSTTEEYSEVSRVQSDQNDFMWQLVSDWENAGQLVNESKCRHVTVRIGLVLGRQGGIIQNLIKPFWLGLGGNLSTGKQWFPWVHVHDVARLFVHAIEDENVSGILNAVAPCKNTNEEFTQAFGKALCRPTLFPVPAFALNLVYGAERADTMVNGQYVIPKRTLECGFKFKYENLDTACSQFSFLHPRLIKNNDDPPL